MLPNKSAKIRSNCVTTFSGPSINIMNLGLGFGVWMANSQRLLKKLLHMFALGQYHRLQWNVISILSDLFFKLKVSLYSPEFILQFWLFSLSMPLTSNQTVYKCHHNSSLEEYCKPDDEHCPISERSFFFVLFTKDNLFHSKWTC